MTWVFCAGMLRSASTLQFQLAADIVERAHIGIHMPYSREADFNKVKELCPDEHKFRVYKVHIHTPALDKECVEHGAMVIYSFRDIRDVAVSTMRKFTMSFDELLHAKWLEQAIADYYHWTKCPVVSVSRYEDFVGDIVNEAEKINGFLGGPLASIDVRQVAENYSIERQQVRINRIRERHGSEIVAKDIVFDPVELLHHNHIHQGEVGGWRRHLADSEKSLLTDKFSVWLKENRYDMQL